MMELAELAPSKFYFYDLLFEKFELKTDFYLRDLFD
jgi:hypothetical protein